jgi:hypothetical protein
MSAGSQTALPERAVRVTAGYVTDRFAYPASKAKARGLTVRRFLGGAVILKTRWQPGWDPDDRTPLPDP